MWPHFSTYKKLQNWNFEPVHTSYTFRWKSEYEFWLKLNLRIMWRLLKATWLQLAKTWPSLKPFLRYKKVNETFYELFTKNLRLEWQRRKYNFVTKVEGCLFCVPLFWTILDIWNNKISRPPYFLRGQILYNFRFMKLQNKPQSL